MTLGVKGQVMLVKCSTGSVVSTLKMLHPLGEVTEQPHQKQECTERAKLQAQFQVGVTLMILHDSSLHLSACISKCSIGCVKSHPHADQGTHRQRSHQSK